MSQGSLQSGHYLNPTNMLGKQRCSFSGWNACKEVDNCGSKINPIISSGLVRFYRNIPKLHKHTAKRQMAKS